MDINDINYRRRIKQADENSKIIIERFVEIIQAREPMTEEDYQFNELQKVNYRAGRVADQARQIAREIQPDWGITILIEMFERLYYGDLTNYVEIGPFVKRAISYIWSENNPYPKGTKKNINSVLDLMKICFVVEQLYAFRPFFLINSDFSFQNIKGYSVYDEKYEEMIEEYEALLVGRGKRMRIAEENSRLFGQPEYFISIKEVLDGKKPCNINFYKGTFFEKIPGIENENGLFFWKSLYTRTWLFLLTATASLSGDSKQRQSGVFLFPEIPVCIEPQYMTQEIVTNAFWTRDWYMKKEDEMAGTFIVERPILRITSQGHFATSAGLIADSINLFIEDSIFGYSSRNDVKKLPNNVFRDAISEAFEDKVIETLARMGFMAGHVSENGIWKTMKYDAEGKIIRRDIDLNCGQENKLAGEVDAFAYSKEHGVPVLVECKVLHDVRNFNTFKNMYDKLIGNSEGFRTKLIKKAEWLDEARPVFEASANCLRILLTDIPLPVFAEKTDDVFLMCFDSFVEAIGELLESIDSVER